MTCTHKKTAVFLLLLALLISLSGLAPAEESPYVLTAQWTDEWGQVQSAQAAPIPYAGYENSFWLQLPQGVMPAQAALYIQDTTGAAASFSVPDGTLLDQAADAGDTLTFSTPMEITGFAQDGTPVLMLRLYVSTTAPLPQDPNAPMVMPARVTVKYQDSQTHEPVATETTTTVQPGTHDVYPEPYDLKANYQLSGNGAQSVTVDQFGANPGEVIFYYDRIPVEPVDITIFYLDMQSMQQVASPTTQKV